MPVHPRVCRPVLAKGYRPPLFDFFIAYRSLVSLPFNLRQAFSISSHFITAPFHAICTLVLLAITHTYQYST